MKYTFFLFVLLLCITSFSACNGVSKQDIIEIYYENEGTLTNKAEVPEFEKIEQNSPQQIRDLGKLQIDSSLFNKINKRFTEKENSAEKRDGAEEKGKYKMYIRLSNGDQYILDNTNVFYSQTKNIAFEDDSLAYIIRDHIHYYNAFKLSELRDFDDFMKYQKHIRYDYLSLVDTTDVRTSYSKIVLLPQ